ncbi:MAG: UDP-N-acetylmuramate dehydrogenase [candidate division FCPU426 bacterium]
MPTDQIFNTLSQASRNQVLTSHSLSLECTFRLGGPAQYFAAPPDTQSLAALLAICRENNLPWFVLGGGSNVLFRDEGVPGLVISTKNMRQIALIPGNLLSVSAGALNQDVTAWTETQGFSGFEWANGLPGSVGGGVYMNARCYGKSFSDIIAEVEVLTDTGEFRTLSSAECGFDYKASVFQTKPWVIVRASLAVAPGDPERIRALGMANRQDREQKGQFMLPSAGCVFKNDYASGNPAGRLIEACGLKGRQVGGVKIYERHANFIVNTGTGTTRDVLALMDEVIRTVWNQRQIRLEPEVRVVP